MPHNCGAFFVWYVLILYLGLMKQSISIFILLILCACSNKQFSFRQKIKVGDNKQVLDHKPSSYHTDENLLVDTFLEASIANTSLENTIPPGIQFKATIIGPSVNLHQPKIPHQHVTDTIVKSPNASPKQTPKYSPYSIGGLFLSALSVMLFLIQFALGFSNIFLLIAAVILSAIAVLLSHKGLNEKGKGKGFAILGFIISSAVLIIALAILMLILFLVLILTAAT